MTHGTHANHEHMDTRDPGTHGTHGPMCLEWTHGRMDGRIHTMTWTSILNYYTRSLECACVYVCLCVVTRCVSVCSCACVRRCVSVCLCVHAGSSFHPNLLITRSVVLSVYVYLFGLASGKHLPDDQFIYIFCFPLSPGISPNKNI